MNEYTVYLTPQIFGKYRSEYGVVNWYHMSSEEPFDVHSVYRGTPEDTAWPYKEDCHDELFWTSL